jgi:hypothetical protein
MTHHGNHLLSAALSYARAGWRVLPLAEKSKVPLKGSRGVRDATLDPQQIERFWTEHPRANIGLVPPRDRFIYDVDVSGDKRGAETLAALEARYGPIPRDMVQITGSGGLHIVMALADGEGPPPALNSLHINVKSSTGYIVAAPSIHQNGQRYKWEGFAPADFAERNKAVSMAPDWLWNAGAPASRGERQSGLRSLTGRLGLDRKQLKRVLNALDHDTYREDREGWLKVGMALHHETGGSLQGLELWHWFSEASGKYDADYLDDRWPGFGKNGERPIRFATLVKAAGMTSELRAEPEDDGDAPKRSTLTLWTPKALADFKPPEEFLQGILRVGEFSSVFGPSTAGKTFLVLDIAYHVALGRPWCGKRVRQKPVLYIGLEGVDGVLNRIRALEIEHGVDSPIHVMTGAFNMREDNHTLNDVIATVEKLGAGLVIIDTLARAMTGGDENSAQDMGAIIDAAGQIQRACNTHVMLVHHSGKDITKGGRGSSALKPALDLEIEMRRDERGLRTATVTKSKNSVDGSAFNFAIKGIEIDRADSWGDPINVGVLAPAEASRFRNLDEPEKEHHRAALSVLETLSLLRDVTWDDLRNELRKRKWCADQSSDAWKKNFQRMRLALKDGFAEEKDGFVTLKH